MGISTIQLANLNEELSKLRSTEQNQQKTRASFFNLILYVQQTDYINFYQKLIKTVISKFPCRVILILCGENSAESYLKTSVTSEIIGQNEQHIYCEIIQIEVAGTLIERVPFIILPQIIPDLPVYLLWTQDPCAENTVLPYLEPLADRIIFDSGLTLNLQRYARSVLELMQRFHCDIGDLNWSACSGWRRLFSEVFNNPKSLASLTKSNHIHIYYNKNKRYTHIQNEIESAYFQAWLASQLNWQFQIIHTQEDETRISYRHQSDEIVVSLSPLEINKLAPGSIVAIEIENGKTKDRYSFKRDPQTERVFIQYSEKDLCHLPYCSFLDGPVAGQEIMEEIFHPSGGKHYYGVLDLLSTISWKQ